MRAFLQGGLVLAGLGAILVGLAFVGGPASSLPYATLQNIPETDIVARGTVSCGDRLGIALALHHPTRGYFMLWMTAQTWLLASFGPEEPSPGTLATDVSRGRWAQREGRSWFVPSTSFTVSRDPAQRVQQFCAALFPEDV